MFTYLSIRFFAAITSWLPYSVLRGLGRCMGSCAFWALPSLRKKALSNLHIAFGDTKSEKERAQIARKSFQNLVITCLEFPKLPRTSFSSLLELCEPDAVLSLHQQGHGMIFFCGHQANWEILFPSINHLIPGGVGVGRPIKNRRLYQWILRLRQSHGGRILLPKQAMKEGLRAIHRGSYIGLVGDQAFPESGYSYPLFGVRSWLSPAPALLSYRTGAPLLVASVVRTKKGYRLTASAPLWPDLEKPAKEAVPHLMDQAVSCLEQYIREAPDQWMWIHDRWKQQTIDHIRRKYRYGFILVLHDPNDKEVRSMLMHVYPRSFLTFLSPNSPELWSRNYRFQLVIDCVNLPRVRRHYCKLGAQIAEYIPRNTLLSTLVKPECQSTVSTSMPR